jgi:hypothetical protein
MDWAEVLNRNGFAVVPDVVAPGVVTTLVAAIDAKGPGPATLERGGLTYAMRDLLREVPETRRLAGSAPLQALVQKVLGPGAFVVHEIHQDAWHW